MINDIKVSATVLHDEGCSIVAETSASNHCICVYSWNYKDISSAHVLFHTWLSWSLQEQCHIEVVVSHLPWRGEGGGGRGVAGQS